MSTAVKERAIIFSKPMILAIDDNRKTQTRRIITDQPVFDSSITKLANVSGGFVDSNGKHFKCPYGRAGDRLWVREAWKFPKSLDAFNSTQIGEKALDAHYQRPWAPVLYLADDHYRDWDKSVWGEPGRYRTARFMPRWASRLTLEVKNIRVERLQDISEADAKAEGIEQITYAMSRGETGWKDYLQGREGFPDTINSFKSLWISINGPDAWHANPWVWVVDFKKL